MKALVKMEITLYDSKGHVIAHDNSEREYETMPSNSPSMFGRHNMHMEELRFAWCAIVENNIH